MTTILHEPRLIIYPSLRWEEGCFGLYVPDDQRMSLDRRGCTTQYTPTCGCALQCMNILPSIIHPYGYIMKYIPFNDERMDYDGYNVMKVLGVAPRTGGHSRGGGTPRCRSGWPCNPPTPPPQKASGSPPGCVAEVWCEPYHCCQWQPLILDLRPILPLSGSQRSSRPWSVLSAELEPWFGQIWRHSQHRWQWALPCWQPCPVASSGPPPI